MALNIKIMKANKKHGMARNGSHKTTISIINNNGICSFAGEKVHKTIIAEKSPKIKGKTLGDMVYESLNSGSYYAYMKRFTKKNNSIFGY